MSLINTIGKWNILMNLLVKYKTNFAVKLRDKHTKAFTKYLLITNLTISTTFSGLGDIIEQTYEIAAGYEDKWDKKRTFKMMTCGLPVGFVCHNWYRLLDTRMPVKTVKNAIKKFFLDQCIGSPMYITTFFVTMSFWNSWSWTELKEQILDKGKSVYTAEWVVWPPAQVINFMFVPPKYRYLYDSTISLGFDTYFSYVTHKELRHKKIETKTSENNNEPNKVDSSQNDSNKIESNKNDSKKTETR